MRRLLLFAALTSLLTSAAVAQTRECFSDFGCPRGKVGVAAETPGRFEELKGADDGDKPVCGLNGSTYASACRAIRLHIGIAYPGACGRCGGATGHTCAVTAFCDIDEGICGMTGAEGWCRPVPSKCAQGGEPVCGCNGKTYGSDCLRKLARVPLLHRGACVVVDLPSADAPPRTSGIPHVRD